MATNKRKTATAAQVESWKKQYGERLKKFEVKTSTNKKVPAKVAYFIKPDLQIVQAADAEHPNDPIDNVMFKYDNCFLGGDEEFENNDEFKLSLARSISQSFRILIGEVKNV